MLKKAMILSSAIALTWLAHAGAYQCKPGDVKVPCEMSAWDVGADALIFQQTSGATSPLDNADMDWKWGFRVQGGYHWGKGKDMNLNWAHYNNTSDITLSPTQRANSGVPAATAVTPLTFFTNSQFDIINIEFGQHVDFGEVWDIRFHAGVQGAYLQNAAYGAALRANRATKSKVNGWGPRAGADITYNLDNGLAFFGDGAVAVLRSRIYNSNPSGLNTTLSNPRQGTALLSMTTTEYRLGAKYHQVLAQGDLTWRVAWEEHDFINALSGSRDLAWDGVSFGLKWLGQA